MIKLFVGYDSRESAAYHTFCQSVMDHSSVPVSFIPLHRPMLSDFDGQKDGTNAFIYSRFLVPYLQDYTGWALFADGDMVCNADIAELWAIRDVNYFNKAACVVKHDYQTKHSRKYIGTPMESDNASYPRKNWSSLILWNCGHYANRILTPEFIREAPGSLLHRFEWLRDEQIGDIPLEWNSLIGETSCDPYPKLCHYTLGVPGFKHYAHCDHASEWHSAHRRVTHLAGQ